MVAAWASRSAAREVMWWADGEAESSIVDLDATTPHHHDGRQVGRGADLETNLWASPVAGHARRPGPSPSTCCSDQANAGSNTAADHVTVPGRAKNALPATKRAGHGYGNDPAEIVVGGWSELMAEGLTLVGRRLPRPEPLSSVSATSSTAESATPSS